MPTARKINKYYIYLYIQDIESKFCGKTNVSVMYSRAADDCKTFT